MTIRVIEDKPDPAVVKNVICQSCGVKLEYVPIDVRSQLRDFDDSREDFIICLKCERKIILNKG